MRTINYKFTENDYINNTCYIKEKQNTPHGLSIVIPTYNRSKMLSITLACLYKQICSYKFQVIIADDGSAEDIYALIKIFEPLLDISYVWQEDLGYRLSAVRNLGMKEAKYSWIAILDCDMAPGQNWVESYCKELEQRIDVALIGHREYIDTNDLDYNSILTGDIKISRLKKVKVSNEITHVQQQDKHQDWRLEFFRNTNNLINTNEPYRYFSGGNVAFHKLWLEISGDFDEDFTSYGGEDNEFAYRLYRAGCFFKHIPGAIAYHQEPHNGKNETNRTIGAKISSQLVYNKIPPLRQELNGKINVQNFVPFVSIVLFSAQLSQIKISQIITAILKIKFSEVELCLFCSTPHEFNLYNSKYKDYDSMKIFNLPNHSISETLNLCSGHLLVFAESSDYLTKKILQKILIEYKNNPLLGYVCYNKSLKNRLLNLVKLARVDKNKQTNSVILRFTSIRTINLVERNKSNVDLSLFNKIEHHFGYKRVFR